ncbi:hypothetical protein D3C81_1444900 [compost metagenome]
MVGRDALALDDVLEQQDQRVDLRIRVRRPDASIRRLAIAGIDQFDADRGGVQPGTPLPLAGAGMPGPAVLVDQLVDGRRVVADQVVGTDFGVGQQGQRARLVGRGVVDDHVLHAAVLADRDVRGVDAQPLVGATGE